MTTSGAVVIKAGANVSSVIQGEGLTGKDADTLINQFINEAESYVNVQTRFNWTDQYSSLNADVQKLLDETVSNIAAIYCIEYDMSGYTSRAEALTMINVLWDRVGLNIQFLKNTEKTDFIKDA